MALVTAPRTLAGGGGWRETAGRLLLFGGVAAAAVVGAAASMFGAELVLWVLLGGTALLVAFASSYAALALLVGLLLVPIGVTGDLPVHINEIDAVYGAALCGLAVRTVASGERVTPGPLGLALVVYVTAGAVALAAGALSAGELATPLNHFRGLFGYALLPLLVLSLGGEGAAEKRRTLLLLLCFAGVLTAGRGVLSWAQLNGLIQLGGVVQRIASPDPQFVGAVPALSGDFGYLRAWAGNFEGNTLGTFVLLLLPIAGFIALREANTLIRIAFAAGAVLLAVALVVSYSRGAYLGLAVAAVPALLALWQRRPLTAIALALASIALLVYAVDHIPGAEDRLVTVRTLHDDPTVQHRQVVYSETVDSITHSPIWGVGLGTSVGAIGTGADSLYLFLLLRGGLLVTASFVVLAWIAVRQVVQAWAAGRLTPMDEALIIALFGFAAHSLVDYTLWNPKVAMTAWLVVGCLLAAAIETRNARRGTPEERSW